MAFGKNSRPEGRKNGSSYCSTITIIVFVALCLVAVWVMTTSSMVPEPNKSASSLENGAELKDQVTENDVKPFEDGFGDLSEDAQKGENSSNQNQRQSEETTQKSYEETQKSPNKDEERNTESGETRKDVEPDTNRQESNDDNELKKESPENASEEHQQSSPEKSSVTEIKEEGFIEEKVNKNEDKVSEQNSIDLNLGTNETFPDGAQSEILNETISQNVTWLTQATESNKEKKVQMESSSEAQGEEVNKYSWKLCNTSSGADYIPCLDNEVAIKQLHSTKHYEHRERHCPDEGPTCLVPLPEGYKQSLKWPKSREKIWYSNVPHIKLAEVKGHQNWVKASGEYLTFPGGGTQFKNGALHYIDFIQESLPDIAWGKQSRVVLDVGCGVASFGGYLFERDVLAMSFAPKDEHEAQVQFALERGIPAISAVMGTRRLPFPSKVFDIVHCARCRVPWHIEGGKLLLELNRVLRPGGYFVWSATPVYQNLTEDVEIWEAMSSLTKSMCWEMMSKTRDNLNQVGVAIYKKPMSNDCYQKRIKNNPPVCKESDDPDAAWNVPLQPCMHRIPTDTVLRGSQWPEQWPKRLDKTPYWLNSSQIGVYGKTAPEDFISDYNHWKRVVKNSYLKGMGINWSHVRNVMDMRSVYGGFAAALRNMKVWVMNVVPVDSADTLPIIYDRGLFGIYHDWCESFNTYPRTYDLLHADHLFSKLKKRCKLESVMAEVDRILRPEGNLIVRDSAEIIKDIESMAKSMSWEIRLMFSEEKEGLLCVHKTMWRPVMFE